MGALTFLCLFKFYSIFLKLIPVECVIYVKGDNDSNI